MMTLVTTMKLDPKAEGEWESLIRERFRLAQDHAGWVSGQLLAAADSPHTRVIVGTWRSREDWDSWHRDPDFLGSRARLDELHAEEQVSAWYEVIEDARPHQA